MTPLAFILIVSSAGLHATWNAIAKKSGASIAFYATLGTVGMLWSLAVRFFTPLRYFDMPPAFFAWLCGMLVSELFYGFGLQFAYRALDMSTAYPLMRSLPLVLLAGITAAFGFGRPLSGIAVAGIAMVFAGCLLVPLRSFGSFRVSSYLNRGFAWVVVVALGTTGYTLCDSQAQKAMLDWAAASAVEVSKPLVSLTYYSFRACTLCTVLWIVVLCGGNSRSEAAAIVRSRDPLPLVAGCCSSLTYTLVLVAMNFVSNVSYVQAFRQIGLLFGLAESAFVLKECCSAPKIAGTALIVAGLAVSVL